MKAKQTSKDKFVSPEPKSKEKTTIIENKSKYETIIEETMQSKEQDEVLSEEKNEDLQRSMIYEKSLQEVKRSSQGLFEKMKPSNMAKVESKVQYHFKERPKDDEIPNSLKPKNMRNFGQKDVKTQKKKEKSDPRASLMSPLRSQNKIDIKLESEASSNQKVRLEDQKLESRQREIQNEKIIDRLMTSQGPENFRMRETQASYNLEFAGSASIQGSQTNRESMNPFSPAKDTSIYQSPIKEVDEAAIQRVSSVSRINDKNKMSSIKRAPTTKKTEKKQQKQLDKKDDKKLEKMESQTAIDSLKKDIFKQEFSVQAKEELQEEIQSQRATQEIEQQVKESNQTITKKQKKPVQQSAPKQVQGQTQRYTTSVTKKQDLKDKPKNITPDFATNQNQNQNEFSRNIQSSNQQSEIQYSFGGSKQETQIEKNYDLEKQKTKELDNKKNNVIVKEEMIVKQSLQKKINQKGKNNQKITQESKIQTRKSEEFEEQKNPIQKSSEKQMNYLEVSQQPIPNHTNNQNTSRVVYETSDQGVSHIVETLHDSMERERSKSARKHFTETTESYLSKIRSNHNNSLIDEQENLEIDLKQQKKRTKRGMKSPDVYGIEKQGSMKTFSTLKESKSSIPSKSKGQQDRDRVMKRFDLEMSSKDQTTTQMIGGDQRLKSNEYSLIEGDRNQLNIIERQSRLENQDQERVDNPRNYQMSSTNEMERESMGEYNQESGMNQQMNNKAKNQAMKSSDFGRKDSQPRLNIQKSAMFENNSNSSVQNKSSFKGQKANKQKGNSKQGQNSNQYRPVDDDFEKEDYDGKWMQKGSSPTKRLLEMKASSTSHQAKVQEIQKQSEYSLKYQPSPQKTIVVEPKDGKIKYQKSMANDTGNFSQVVVQYNIENSPENQEADWGKQTDRKSMSSRRSSLVDKPVSVKQQNKVMTVYREHVPMEVIEREVKEMREQSPDKQKKSALGGWFTCETCGIKSDRITQLSLKQ